MNLRNLVVVAGVFLIKALLSSHPHSGQGTPPMFGDYEAQRHWMEVTVNLPVSEWYHNTTKNDLQYWGLDYPPLTAYHSWIMGQAALRVDPGFVALHESRGREDEAHRTFMRSSVLVADLLVWIPSVAIFAKVFNGHNDNDATASMAFILLYPGLMLVDNGHFQYNNVSLGFFILAVALLAKHMIVFGSIFFCLALNYKQMELYHALPFFFYLLGLCWKERSLGKLVAIAATVVATMVVVWLPFLSSVDSALQVVHRIFPFARGVFEDKVANFWCTLNILVKIKTLLPISTMATASLATTFALSMVSNLHLFSKPTISNFLVSLVNTSIVFYLFSFQVHEKSILLVAIPVGLFACGAGRFNEGGSCFGRYSSILSVWFMVISTFSMFPLLVRDGLALPAVSLTVFYVFGCASTGFLDPVVGVLQASSVTAGLRRSPRNLVQPVEKPDWRDDVVLNTFVASMFGCVGLIVAFFAATPPPSLPDLYPVLISAYSAMHFMCFLIYFHYIQIKAGSEVTVEKKTN